MENLIADTVLMVRPASFQFNEETSANNSFQNKIQVTSTFESEVLEEFDNCVSQLKDVGINVEIWFDSPIPYKPDAIFPNNWFSTHTNGQVFLFPMFAENRRLERDSSIINFLNEKYEISEIIDLSFFEKTDQFLEGTGSIVFCHEQKIAFANRSPRTNEAVLKKYCNLIGYQHEIFDAYDMKGLPIYHTNVLLCFGPGFAVICLDSVPLTQQPKLLDALSKVNHEIIAIKYYQMEAFAGNMLCLRNKLNENILVLSETAYKKLLPEQLRKIENYCRMLVVKIPMIEKVGGGGVRCMMAEIFLPKKSIGL